MGLLLEAQEPVGVCAQLFIYFYFYILFSVLRNVSMLHVQRIAGDMCGDTFLLSVTDPLLQSLWRSAVGYCW